MLRTLRHVPTVTLAAAAALTLACRDTGGGDDTQADARVDAPGVGVTIQDVQSDTMVPGTPVDLRGKVVTAIDTFGARTGNFWIGEEGGGAYSGVLVFGAPVEQVALLTVGDKVDITGAEKTEFALTSDTSGRTTTELQPVNGGAMTVTKVGTGTVPEPTVVDALAIGLMDQAGRDAEWEKWEGVLIKVQNVAALNDVRYIRSSTAADDCTFREFEVAGGLRVDSSLAAIPGSPTANDECMDDTADLVSRGDCLAAITGIGDYFFNYKILPRATSAIETGGTGCVVENTAEMCSDTIDNDGNGFIDCADFSCQVFPQCVTSTTVEMIQTGAVPVNALVTLDDVIVTAVSFNRRHLWVSDTAAAAVNKGIYVFRGGSTSPDIDPAIMVGDHVSIAGGKVSEFGTAPNTITEITPPGGGGGPPVVTIVAGSTRATVTPVADAPIATLVDRVNGEPYEGVLVELRNVRVAGPIEDMTVPPATFPTFQRPLAIGSTAFEADDDVYRMTTETTGTCYASVVGVWHYNTFSDTDNWVFLPRSAGDFTAGGVCP